MGVMNDMISATDYASARQVLAAGLMLALALLRRAATQAQAAMKIQEVKSDKGITAWLVEDYSVPIIAMRFAFDGGSTQDPKGKEGLANLMTSLFDEGAGDLDSEAFQIRLDDAGAEMRFSASRDQLYGSMRMLADQKDEATELLRVAITEPRFDAAPVARIKSQIVAGIQASAKDPQTEAQRRWLAALYGDHPYARPDDGTEESLAAIGADDLRALHRSIFARGRLHIAVVGAIDAETLKRDLDRIFGALARGADTRRRGRRDAEARPEDRLHLCAAADDAAACLSRHRTRQAGVLRRRADEPDPGRLRLHVAPVQGGAREARPDLRRRTRRW